MSQQLQGTGARPGHLGVYWDLIPRSQPQKLAGLFVRLSTVIERQDNIKAFA